MKETEKRVSLFCDKEADIFSTQGASCAFANKSFIKQNHYTSFLLPVSAPFKREFLFRNHPFLVNIHQGFCLDSKKDSRKIETLEVSKTNLHSSVSKKFI